jgi:membrane protein DedA with SNARE-associated domain
MKSSVSLQLLAYLTSFSSWQAYGAILGMLFVCGLGLPIPEDITLIAAGILASAGTISLTGAIIAGLIGVLIGDAFMYFLGYKFGHKVFALPMFRKVFTPKRIRQAEEKILSNSKFICFIARFLPGLRSPIFLSVGVMKVPFWQFLALDGLAALISVPFWVILAWYIGQNLDDALEIAKKFQTYILIGVALVIGIYWFFSRKKKLSPPSKTQVQS